MGKIIRKGIEYSGGSAGGGGGASSWQDLENKPFETLSDNFEVEDGELDIAKDIALVGTPTAPDPDKTDGTATRIATSGYVTRSIADAIKDIVGIKFEKVETLPSEGKTGIIYLVPKTPAGTSDIYTEYYWIPPVNPYYLMQPFGTPANTYKILLETYNDIANGILESYSFNAHSDYVVTLRLVDGEVKVSYSHIPDRWYSISRDWNKTATPKMMLTGGEPGKWEILGDTSIDLSNYVSFDDISEMTTTEVQTAWDAKFKTT